MGLRRKGREIVLQALYNLDVNKDYIPPESDLSYPEVYLPVLQNILQASSIKADHSISTFSDNLLRTVVENLIPIDDMIKNRLEHWSIEQLAVLDRNLLRLALAEIVYHKTPAPIVIDEALEIAKKFCGEQTGKLINGILDGVVKDLKQEDG